MNILTSDVEEWFHLLDNDSTRSEEQWKNYEVRIYENMERIFDILERTNTKATFFIIGWIAKTYPDIVKRISEKYEIGSHTMNHQLVWQQTPEEFDKDVEQSIKTLQDITGKDVKYFRAPGFSIRKSEGWAYEILSKYGIEIDCSVFPTHHAHGGMPEYGESKPKIITHNGMSIKELPITTGKVLGKQIVFSGGGYFRLLPYWLIKSLSSKSSDYMLAYIHPRDLDAGQPMIKELPLSRKFKSYVGLKNAPHKFEKWLSDFKFVDIKTANVLIDWDKAEKIII